MSNPESSASPSPEELVDQRIAALADWRGETLRLMRQRVRAAGPAIIEEWKWAKATSPGVPVWSCAGIVCTGEVYTSVVKLTFARGAALADPRKLFNASLEGRVRRAIDIRKGEQIDADAFEALVRAAVALNRAMAK
jgi:hypothetical protein